MNKNDITKMMSDMFEDYCKDLVRPVIELIKEDRTNSKRIDKFIKAYFKKLGLNFRYSYDDGELRVSGYWNSINCFMTATYDLDTEFLEHRHAVVLWDKALKNSKKKLDNHFTKLLAESEVA